MTKATAIAAVAAMIGVMFAGSTLLTPLYIIYKQQFGFSDITLTLIYAAYVVGNAAALLIFGRASDQVGRRDTALAALGINMLGTLTFLLADGTAALYWGRTLTGFGIGIAAGTGTAWLAELVGADDKARATAIATSTNFLGIALGSLLSGVLAQFAPWPLHLSFVVYALILLSIGALVRFAPETIARPAHSLRGISLRPRVGVPHSIRAQFVAPAVTGFGAMALVGFYAALAPSILAHELNYTSHALAGALVCELGLAVSITIVATQRLTSRVAMLWALVLMIPSVGMIVAAQLFASMAVTVIGTALCGVASGLGYRGSLQVINQIAPEARRAEVTSSYFVCAFSGNALPVIGVGVISAYGGMPLASMIFAAMIAVFSIVALIFGSKYSR